MNLRYGVKEETYKLAISYESWDAIDSLFGKAHIDLLAAKNQSAAFQVVLYSDEEFSLSVTDSTYFDKRGIIENIRLKMENCPFRSTMNLIGLLEDDDKRFKADILLNQETVYVKKKRAQAVWLELDIPETASPGEYHGAVGIYQHIGFETERRIGEMSFKITVKNVTLPAPSEYSFYLDLWQHNSNIARKHEVVLWSDEHFNIMEKYVESLAKLGQKAISLILSEIPWSGQFCYRDSVYTSDLYEYNMIKLEKDADGELKLDFSAVDRYIELCFKYGVNKEIEVFGLFNIWMCEEEGFGKVVKELSDGVRVRYLDKKDGCFKYIDTVDGLIYYIKQIERYFIDKGVIDIVRIIADEPEDVDIYNERLDFLKKTAPEFKYKAAICHTEFIDEFKDKIEDFVPIFSIVCKQEEEIRRLKKAVSGRICWYVCCIPDLLNTFLRSELLESHIIGWLTEYMGLDGFLRWNYTVWPDDPRNRISFRTPFWKAGDTNFVYPSNNGAPLLSLRYKALLRGIQIFELLQMLKKSNPDADRVINDACKRIFKFEKLMEWNPDSRRVIHELISLNYEDYIKALNDIMEAILI